MMQKDSRYSSRDVLRARTSGRERLRQVFRVAVRLLQLAAAAWYIATSIAASTRSFHLMRGIVDSTIVPAPYFSSLIPHFVGKSALRASPLVVECLENTTTPRNGTLYLHSKTNASFDDCTSDVELFNPWAYSDEYLRQNLAEMTDHTAYNFTFLDESELILPVVDCTSGAIVHSDFSSLRVFYLMRSKADPNEVAILTWSMSVQDYELPREFQNGAAASVTLTFITDVRNSVVTYHHALRLGFPFQFNVYQPYMFRSRDTESLWVLESVPRNLSVEAVKIVSTAARVGFYVNALTEQRNLKNLNWNFETTPIRAMAEWNWSGYSSLRDSWAWVHGVHVFFAADALFNLIVLIIVVYHNATKGKIWIGDAFVSISSTLLPRAVIIFLSWTINNFWTLMEFCIGEGSVDALLPHIVVFEDIIYADLLAIFMGGLMGHLLQERIDPALTIILCDIGFRQRRAIAAWFPKLLGVSAAFAGKDYSQGLAPMEDDHASLTPMRYWTVHTLAPKDPEFILAALWPTFSTFILVVVYALMRKTYLHFFPPRLLAMSRVTAQSGAKRSSVEVDSTLSWKGTLSVFEIATGAPLQNRVGLVSDYDNCVYIKGMKFASADGIYCNGYVIANAKWLIPTEHLFVVMLIVLTRVRFRDVYVYEVDGFNVQKTARLLYPQMLSVRELFRLNVSMLA